MRYSSAFNLAMRRLLQVDLPTPPRSEAEIAAEVERNYRWNFAVNLLDGATFWFGLSFISSATILPLFISKLTASPLPIAIVVGLAQGGWFLPQLFTANFVERLDRKKPVVVNLGFFLERMPTWPLPLAALAAAYSPPFALALFLVSYAGFGLGAGVVATAWQDLIARCFPVNRRGRYMGLSFFLGAGAGALGATLSARLLDTLPFPASFVAIFSIAAGSITFSWVFLALTREPVQPANAPRQSQRQFFAALPDLLRRDRNFSRYMGARLLLALGNMGVGFVTVAAISRWQVADSTVGIYTTALLVGQTIGHLIAGYLADRFGHKLSLELSALAALTAFGLAWWAPTPEWYFVVFVLLGYKIGSVIISGTLVALEFSSPERRPTYVGLSNTAVGLMNIAAPFVGAGVANANYSALFAVSAAANLVSFGAMHWWVQEPRRTSMNARGQDAAAIERA